MAAHADGALTDAAVIVGREGRRPERRGPVNHRVCRAGARDVDRIAPLFDAYRRFYGAASDVTAARRYLAARLERDESVVLIALAGGSGAVTAELDGAGLDEVVGFAQLYRSFSSLALAETVILNDLFVVPTHRQAGVGDRLIDEAAAFARSVSAVRLELATQHTNRAALRLYRAKGFVPDSEFAHLSLAIDSAKVPSVAREPCHPERSEGSSALVPEPSRQDSSLRSG